MLAPLVEEPEEPLARTDAIDAGTREFGELGCRGHCGGGRKLPILAVPGDLPCAVTCGDHGRQWKPGGRADGRRRRGRRRGRVPARPRAGTRQSLATPPHRAGSRDRAGSPIPTAGSAKRRRRKTLRRTRCSTARRRTSRRLSSPRVNGGVTSVTPRRCRRSASAASAARQVRSRTVNPSRPAVDPAPTSGAPRHAAAMVDLRHLPHPPASCLDSPLERPAAPVPRARILQSVPLQTAAEPSGS